MNEAFVNVPLDDARAVLQKKWGFDSFRTGQEQAVKAVLSGRDALVILPTGGGKSVCYQIPAVVMEGFTLVISPLIALMQDQVEGLQQRGVSATYINSTLSKREVDQRWTNAEHGQYDLVYVAPERLESSLFEARAERLPVNLLAVDEAHCVSEWGHHFRPAYLKIKEAREKLGGPPQIAVTATATPEVRRDVIEQLDLRRPVKIVQGFDRPNLVWAVFQEENKRRKVLEIARKVPGSGLVYVATRRSVETWTNWLTKQGISAAGYHGGMHAATREQVQERWLQDELRLVVATNAFGMGIDKPDVRFVIHVELPGSVEAYYQEAGRGGRDGNRAYAVLLYQEPDAETQQYLIDSAHPSQQEVQEVYAAICNLAQVPLNDAPDAPIQIDIDRVSTLSGCTPGKIKTAVDLIEREHLWVTLPNRRHIGHIRFKQAASQVRSYAASQSNEAFGEFLRVLLRTVHADAFMQWWSLDLRLLERRTNLGRERLLKGLEYVADRGLIDWLAPNKALRIELLQPRSAKPPIDNSAVRRARKRAEKRLEHLTRYAQSVTCRRKYLLNYFGESCPEKCGRCDICLGRHDGVSITPDDEPHLRQILGNIRQSSNREHWQIDLPVHQVNRYLDWLLQEEYIRALDTLDPSYQLTEKAHQFLAGWQPAHDA